MCGRGTIGLVVSLTRLGHIQPGGLKIDTPIGAVTAELHPDGSVSAQNGPADREAQAAAFDVPGHSFVRGDVAWGGNWFFLVREHPLHLELASLEALTEFTWRVRQAVNARGFPAVDHLELFAPSPLPGADSRNFVLCPGHPYDRSPCGTGTSAKLACLAAADHLAEGAPWVQESLIGSRFIGSYRWLDRAHGKIIPTVTGTAHVMAETTLLLDERDWFCWGIRA